MSGPRLLTRVFEIDIEQCPQCAGSLKIIAEFGFPLASDLVVWGSACQG